MQYLIDSIEIVGCYILGDLKPTPDHLPWV